MKPAYYAALLTLLVTISLTAQDAFVTQWQTTTANESITIPTTGSGYNYTVDWGDGTPATTETGNATHTYATAGTYTVSITGAFPQIFFNNSGDKDKIIAITQWGTQAWTSMERAFYGCSKLNLTATDAPNLSQVRSMAGMFAGATAFNGAIGHWDVSKVTDMEYMFWGATSFNQDLSKWNTSSVTNMESMFNFAIAFNQDLSNWDVSKVTSMSSMFRGVTLSTAHYDAMLSAWSKQAVQNGVGFNGGNSKYCTNGEAGRAALQAKGWSFFDGGKETTATCAITGFVTQWQTTTANESITIPTTGGGYNYTVDWGDGTPATTETGNATHTYATAGAYTVSITGAFPQIFFNHGGDRNKIVAITQWGTQAWSSMEAAFYGCSKLNLTATDAPNLSQVSSVSAMFGSAITFNGAIGHWDVSKVTDMEDMFRGATSFNQDLSNWDVSSVTNMASMFDSATSFNQDIGNWDVSSVTRMDSMFSGATTFNQDLSNWDVSKVTDMAGMFRNVTLSTAHYDAMLSAWSKQDVQNGISFHGGNSKYCTNGEAGKMALQAKGWSFFFDGGKDTTATCATLSVVAHNTAPWQLSPNPTHGVLHISGTTPVEKATVYALTGQQLLEVYGGSGASPSDGSGASPTDNTALSLQDLRPGMYLVKLTNENKTQVFRIIKE